MDISQSSHGSTRMWEAKANSVGAWHFVPSPVVVIPTRGSLRVDETIDQNVTGERRAVGPYKYTEYYKQ